MPPSAPVSTRRLALLLGGLAMFGPFSIDTIFPAFPQIGAQFTADKLAMQQTISVYLLAYAAMSLVPVSYTHLDVYKRQSMHSVSNAVACTVPTPNSFKPAARIAV